MQEKSKTEIINSDFKEIINKHSDEQILEILKKRDYYQPEAVKIAVNEAIERKLIHSEQDLFSPDFTSEPLKRKLIPDIKREKNKKRIRKSIARSLLIAGVLPLIFGFVQYNNSRIIEGAVLLIFGLAWMFLSSQLIRKESQQIVVMLFLGAFLSMFYVTYLFVGSKTVIFMDVFIVVLIYLFIFYGLLFIRKLLN
jgi:hypothetical protein